ncbi:MAG: hypothetical protein LBJ67_02080 [Planctomycetaceae bacterium]|jgi:lipid-A-disaccharide synthase|nr:hypothetical protein [Planctomycetaceae bacterium]
MPSKHAADSQSSNSIQIFFSAGEPSGDAHAASLIREIQACDLSVQCVGYGGPLMHEAGQIQHYDLTQKAVMFFKSVLGQITFFRSLYRKTQDYFSQNQQNIKAVVLVDYPGFNWWVARAAKNYAIPVYYFMPPQLWAWAGWRIKKMHKLVDFVFTTMPFETKWFQNHDCKVIEIGHPFLEEAKRHIVDSDFLKELHDEQSPILVILPGSRDQEIKNNLQDLLHIVEKACHTNPEIRPMIAAFKQSHVENIEEILSQRGLAIPVYIGKTQELIRAAHFALAVSGSVTMELLANHVPTVVYYRVGKIAHFAQRFFRRSRYITLVNLLGLEFFTSESPYFPEKQRMIPAYPTEHDFDAMLFPEFLTPFDASDEATECLLAWLEPQNYTNCKKQLEILHAHLDPARNPFQIAAETLLKASPMEVVDETDEFPAKNNAESKEYDNKEECNEDGEEKNKAEARKEDEKESENTVKENNIAEQTSVSKSSTASKQESISLKSLAMTSKQQSITKQTSATPTKEKKKEPSDDEFLFQEASSSLLKKLSSEE